MEVFRQGGMMARDRERLNILVRTPVSWSVPQHPSRDPFSGVHRLQRASHLVFCEGEAAGGWWVWGL